MSKLLVRPGLAVAISLLFVQAAQALPAVTKTHPRLYATQDDFNRIEQEAGVGVQGAFPSAGSVSFDLYPVEKGSKDVAGAPIFGQDPDNGTSANGFMIYYSLQPTGLYVAATLYDSAGRSFAGSSPVPLTPGVRNTITFTYNTATRLATLTVNGTPKPMSWTQPWEPTGQQFSFRGHRGDAIANFKLTDTGKNQVLWQSDRIDPELHSSWRATLVEAKAAAASYIACQTTVTAFCNDVLKGGRNKIVDPARRLAMAYRYTRDETLLTGIRAHIGLIKGVSPLTTGGEWSMSSRVGALGLYYDWLYSTLGTAERDAIAAHIKLTIRADNTNGGAQGNDDLIYSTCGGQPLAPSVFDCNAKPVFQNWNRYATPKLASISDSYISGHSASAVSLIATSLLAIVEDGVQPKHTDVLPMLDTIHSHFKLGYLRARDLYSVDGGNTALFAYASGAGETSDRLVMWQRALSGNSGLQLASQGKYLYPYIYGQRSDRTFPARGDNYAFFAEYLGSVALGSRVLNPANTDPNAPDDVKYIIDPLAYAYYRNVVQPARAARNTETVWERVLYPQRQALAPMQLPAQLSRHFRVAGNVLIRDSWDNAVNTLLEFKSASYISENHHHLDQNSFSLYYKAPLLLDSGQYDNYATSHWKNYYQRTIAHNAIVLEPGQQDYIYYSKPTARDGGQWYANKLVKRENYPTVEEALLPGGSNLLHGVTGFEDGGDYVYVAGNASKAYPALDIADTYIVNQSAGMQRSIVYLRRPASRLDATPPLILVFDSVRSKVAATSLLHMVRQPAGDAPIARTDAGRYKFGTGAGTFTVRNGGGMVTIQTLLPKKETRAVALVGGKDNPNDLCEQYKDGLVNNEVVGQDTGKAADCRFLVRNPVGAWRNYPPRVANDPANQGTELGMPPTAPDIGEWRLEISDTATLPADAAGYRTQTFLNALHVANSDDGSGVVQPADAPVLLDNQGPDTTAVKVSNDLAVVFNGGALDTTSLKWQPGSFAGKTLLVGLRKSGCYALNKSAPMWELKSVASACTHSASANGVLLMP